jgi:hypothetical protein
MNMVDDHSVPFRESPHDLDEEASGSQHAPT